jgi:hypothetical protein
VLIETHVQLALVSNLPIHDTRIGRANNVSKDKRQCSEN